jgi:hypothetical protein
VTESLSEEEPEPPEPSEPPEAPETSDAPAPTVLLTEVPLKALDVTRITALHEGDEPAYRVLVPADTKRNVLVSVLNHLSLFEMREALEALKPINRTSAQTDAETTLAESLRVLQEAGVEATGAITQDDPLPTLETEVARLQAGEVIIVTEPHAVQDTFHTDWASEARDRLGVPVLHVYSGDWRLG